MAFDVKVIIILINFSVLIDIFSGNSINRLDSDSGTEWRSKSESQPKRTANFSFCERFLNKVTIQRSLEKCANQVLSFYDLMNSNSFNETDDFNRNVSDSSLQQKSHFHRHKVISNRTKRNTRHTRLRNGAKIRIIGFRLEDASSSTEIGEEGIPNILANSEFSLRLFGDNLNEHVSISFTQHKEKYGTPCEHRSTGSFSVEPKTLSNNSVVVKATLPLTTNGPFYICAIERKKDNVTLTLNVAEDDDNDNDNEVELFIHQGDSKWLCLRTYNTMLPLWLTITIIVICLSFSFLFSGLNLGLMSLDKTDLRILCNTGSDAEKSLAKLIRPVREKGNYLLCSILLGNVFVNSIFTILLDSLTSGLFAVIFSTLTIVIFGEIVPQAICSRHGLLIGAKTINITKTVMFITGPLSYPISKVLDCILKEEIGIVYTRERLKELVKMSTANNDLDKDEVNIISGALELRKKCVKDVMTHIEDVFMLNIESVLDFETVSEIMKSGFSRVPVFEDDRQNLVSILYIKDLAFVDPDDKVPLRSHCQFYQNHCYFVFEDTKLDIMFKQFKEGNKGHMAFVQRVNNIGDRDPFYEIIGLVTLEDVIEELIQAEIMDETDVFTDNRSKRRRNAHKLRQDFSMFVEKQHRSFISPQLALATFQFLTTSVDPFKREVISNTILHRLLKQDIIFHVKLTKEKEGQFVLYRQGEPADYFILILEGRVEVTVGRENLVFDSGPFTYFGTQALCQNIGSHDSPLQSSNIGSVQSLNIESAVKSTFIPDYTVKAISEIIYIQIKRSMYMAAKRATLMERTHTKGSAQADQFDCELDQIFNCCDDDNDFVSQKTPQSVTRSPLSNSKKGSPVNRLDQNGRVSTFRPLNSKDSSDNESINEEDGGLLSSVRKKT